MPAAAAEAPAGSHQVFAIKKYVLTKVISQMTTRRMRPMQRAPRVGFSAFPTEALLEFSLSEKWGMETGWNISQVFLSASRFFNLLFFVARVFVRIALQIFLCSCCNHPLTNFFVLSNIRFVSGGSSEMLRTSRCFRINFLQSAGPRTL